MAKYQYDSFGNCILITDTNGSVITNYEHIAHINPFRYRSYYYDKETNLYYLNGRYYNPLWGRFLNIDDYLGKLGMCFGYNLYQYAFNNPINYDDKCATFPDLLKYATDAFNYTRKKISDGINYVKNVVKKSFILDIGVGVGMEADIYVGSIKVKGGYSKTTNYTISNGAFSQSNTTSIGVETKIAPNTSVGLNKEVNHIYHNDSWSAVKHNNPVAFIKEIQDCSNTTERYLIGTKYKDSTSEASSDGIFIGLGFGVFAGIGASIKIGFNIGGN